MAAGSVTDGIGHGKDCQAERERNAEKAYAGVGKCRSQDSAAATPKNQPESAEKFRDCFFAQIHGRIPFRVLG